MTPPVAPVAPPPVQPVPPVPPPAVPPPFEPAPGQGMAATVAAAAEHVKKHHSLFQPRDEGKFAGPPDQAALAAAAEPPVAAPPAEPAADGADPAEGQPAAEGDALAEIEVEIPGRQPGETLKLAVTDPELADRLRQLNNGYVRGNELREQARRIEEREASLEEREYLVGSDPLSILGTYDPSVQANVTLTMLAQPGVWEKVAGEIEQWLADENVAGRRRAEIGRQYLEARDDVRQQVEDRRMVRRAVGEYHRLIDALMPPTLTEAQQALFKRDALNDIRVAAADAQHGFIHPRDVPSVLEPRLLGHGLTPDQIRQALAALRGGRDALPPPAKPAVRVVNKPTGQQLVEGQKRRDAAIAPPPGPGAPISRVQFNSNDNIASRIAALKQVRVKSAGG